MANTQMTHKYIPRIDKQREQNLFLEEYYSGTDTKVYLNNKEQTEISYISFSLNEQLKPIYGYASRTFDDMAVGSRIVTGILKMPIKNPEEQDSYETVVLGNSSSSTLEEIENNNQIEEEIKNNTEWLDNNNETQKPTNGEILYNEILEYQTKLKQLGYDVSESGSLTSKDIEIIKKFQKENKLLGYGFFNNDTKAVIDSKLESLLMSHIDIRTMSKPANVYAGPNESSGKVYIVHKSEEIQVFQEINGYYYIKTGSGMYGYIKASDLQKIGEEENGNNSERLY